MGDYKCDVCKKEFKNQWRLTNHECPGPEIKKIDLGPVRSETEVNPRDSGMIKIEPQLEPEPILEAPVPLDPKKHSRDWSKEILSQRSKKVHKYL